jgi:hypothetical protein
MASETPLSVVLYEPCILRVDRVRERNPVAIRRWHCPALNVTKRGELAILLYIEHAVSQGSIDRNKPSTTVRSPHQTLQIRDTQKDYFPLGRLPWFFFQVHHATARIL